jgi:gliding motility-associated-like protein
VQNPQHRYNAIGLYTTTLRVTSNAGCVDSIRQSFTVNEDIPDAFFVFPSQRYCSNDSITIADSSRVNFGNVTRVEIYWDRQGSPAVFEADELPFPGKQYRHKYPEFQQPLTRDVFIKYKAYSGASCVDSVERRITLQAAPLLQFAIVPPLCPEVPSFQLTQAAETGGVPGTGVYSGTGTNGAGIFTPGVTGPGTFPLLYTYTSTAGCVDTAAGSITVLAPAVANFGNSTPTCARNPVSFTDSSTIPAASGSIVSWSWNFGDGSPVTVSPSAIPVNHVFAAAAAFPVTLTIRTSNGCSYSRQRTVTVHPLPVPAFAIPASVCLPSASVTFTDNSTIADGTGNSFTYLWNFDDAASGAANISRSKNPTHVFNEDRIYRISLTVTSGNQCTDSVTIPLNTIHPQPTAAIVSDSVSICENQTVRFSDASTGGDGVINEWNWDFRNGNTSALQFPPAQSYATARVYPVTLEVTDNFGCRDTVIQSFTVFANPVISAGPDRVLLEGGEIIIGATASGNGLSFSWTPADYLSGSRLLTPVVKGIPADIVYTLQVVAAGGCKASDDVLVKLLKAPVIPNTFTPNGDGINDFWTIQYLDSYPDCRLQVFNRSGQQVFESYGYLPPGWDGKLKGKDLPFGTYYYIIEPGSGRKPITGYVTILY